MAEACVDDDVHQALFAKQSRYAKWRKRWFDEILPVAIYARNLGISHCSQMRIPHAETPACDVQFRHEGIETKFEVTVADLALHPRWQEKDSHFQPGAQAAAIRRKLQRDGFVEPYNPIDGKTLKPFHDAHGETPESRLEACVNGLQFALNGKARGNGYGNGSTLIAYGREFPFFLRCSKNWQPRDLLERIVVQLALREFDRVLLVAEGRSWTTEIVS